MRLRQTVWAALMAGGLAGAAHAASLGEIVVSSRLGEPLQARVLVQATPEELRSLSVRLADLERYREAGIVPSALLPQLSAKLVRESGQTAVLLTTREPVRDPFVNVLLDLSWNGGRILREYAILLDPPQYALPTVPQAPGRVHRAAAPETSAATARPATKATTSDKEHVVRRGETLGEIAARWREGQALEAAMYAIWKHNPEAFIAGDPNRLKAGAVLSRPDIEQIAAVPARDLQQWRQTHLRPRKMVGIDRMAEMPDAATVATPTGGQIVAREALDQRPAVPSHDRVEISPTRAPNGVRSERTAGKKGAGEALAPEDVLALKGQLQEAQERISALEAQVARLGQLIELQSQTLAALQAGPAQPPVSPAVAPPQPAIPAPSPMPATAPEQAPAPASVSPSSVSASAQTSPAAPVTTETTEPAAAPQLPKRVAAPAPQTEVAEPGFIDFLLEQPLVLGGAAAALLVGAGALMWRRRRAQGSRDEEQASSPATTETTTQTMALTHPSTEPPTVGLGAAATRLGAATGQEVDTNVSILGSDFTQVAFNALQADEGIDPVAEAEVLLAYDRDAQAEEILVDALKQTPSRVAIPLKLLEIYGRRHDASSFEHYFAMVGALSGRAGREWDQALALRQKYFPELPQEEEEAVPAPSSLADLSHVADQSPSDEIATPTVLPKAGSESPPEVATVLSFEETEEPVSTAAKDETSATETATQESSVLDFTLDLDLPTSSPRSEQPREVSTLPPTPEASGLDWAEALEKVPAVSVAESLPEVQETAEASSGQIEEEAILLPEISLSELPEPTPPSAFQEEGGAEVAPLTETSSPSDSASWLSEETAAGGVTTTSAMPEGSIMTNISELPAIDLDTLAIEPSTPEGANDSRLQLARAYIDMEDYEGARELIEEVLRDGDEAAQAAARAMLAQLPQATA